MKAIQDADDINDEEAEAVIITGDGKNETDRIKYLVKKYNDDDQLYFPHGTAATGSAFAIKGGKKSTAEPESKKGLVALESIRDHENRDGIRSKLRYKKRSKYLVLSDREDVTSDFQRKVESRLSKFAEITKIEQLESQSFYIKVKHGGRDIFVYFALIGDDTGCFEDGLAKLGDKLYDKEITGENRDELKGSVKDKCDGIVGKSLLSNAERYDLKICFPNLHAALDRFVSDRGRHP